MRLIASIIFAGLVLLPGHSHSDVRPIDPHLCLVPVYFGPAEETRSAGRHPDPSRVQFLPGYPTPIFFAAGLPGALYIDPEGRLRPHPKPVPAYMTRYYLGSEGTVFAWFQPELTLFFDPDLGYFRSIEEASPKQRAELRALRERLREDAVSILRLGWGGVHPTRSRPTAADTHRNNGRSAWRVEAPGLGIEIEGNGDRLTVAKGDRRAAYIIPGLSGFTWQLTELPRSGRAVLVSLFESRMLIVDEDLNLTRPAGEWRLPTQPEVLLLPETGEALVTTFFALFWLRDKRISGADICGDTEPPPEQPIRLITPPGTEHLVQADNDRVSGFWPDPESETVLLHSKHGVFRLSPDGVVRKLTAPDYHYQYSHPIPGTDQVLVNAGQRFVVVDDEDIVFDSGIIAERCCLNLRPILRNPATGSVLLDNGQYLTRDYQLRQLDVPGTDLRLFSGRPAVASPAWLPGPLLSGFLWDEDDELRSLGITLAPPRPDRLGNRAIIGPGFWITVDRFQFLMTIIKGWRKLGTNLRLEQMPGQPDVYLDKTWGGGQPPTALFDPGKGDVLLGLQEGLWTVRADGTMRKIECSDGCAYRHVTSIVAAPDDAGLAYIGTAGGLFRYDPGAGSSLVRLAPIDQTGSVFRLHSFPWQGTTLIEADFGNFTWDADQGLRRLDIDVSSWFIPRFIVTHAPRRVFVRDTGLTLLQFPEYD